MSEVNRFSSPVILEKNGHTAIVRLNRPEKKNAMSFALLKSLIKTANQIKKDKSIRAVIVTGGPDFFSSGIDLADLNNPKNAAYAVWELVKPGQSLFQKAFLIWQSLPVPVIVAINGYCFGAGMQMALAGDFRIAAPTSKLSIMEGKWGLVPDMGITNTLRGLMPLDKAKELTMTAKVLSGEEALAYNLVTHLNADPEQAALDMAKTLEASSPDALLADKRVLNAMVLDPERALRMEKLWQLKLLFGKNRRIALARGKKPELKYHPRQFS